MSFLGLFGPKPVTQPVRSETKVREQPGPLSAKAALGLVMEQVKAVDSRYVLTMVTTGDVNERGLAYTWDFLFDFPRRAASGVFIVQACDSDQEIDTQPLCVVTFVKPRPAQKPPAPLPLDFIDSPETVQALAAQGANYISGPSDMPLSSKILSGGTAVWVTYMYDREFQAPFKP